MILLVTDSEKYDLPLNRLEAVLNGQFDVKLVNGTSDEIILANDDRGVDRHGGVLLISQDKAEPEGVLIE